MGLRKHHYEQTRGGDGIPAELFQILKDDAVKVLHLICQQIWKTQQWPQEWKSQFSFQSQRTFNYCTIALVSHAGKEMLKVLHTRLQEYMGQELPDIQDGLRKGRGGRDQKANSLWVIEKAIEVQKNVYLCFTDYTKAFVWITTNWKIP